MSSDECSARLWQRPVCALARVCSLLRLSFCRPSFCRQTAFERRAAAEKALVDRKIVDRKMGTRIGVHARSRWLAGNGNTDLRLSSLTG